MTRRSAPALALIVAACVAAIVCNAAPDWPALRAPAGLLLAFVLPGAALTGALFPAGTLDLARRVTLTVGLSMAVSVILAAEIGVFDQLSGETWSTAVAGVTVVAALVMHARSQVAARTASTGLRRPSVPAMAMAAAACVLVAAAVVVARTPLAVPDDRGYTVLTIGPSPDGGSSVIVGLTSEEAATRDFRLVVTRPGASTVEVPVRLAPGERRREVVEVPRGAIGEVEARLVEAGADASEPYRRVRIPVPAQPAAEPAEEGTS